jgi:hypothetical protein
MFIITILSNDAYADCAPQNERIELAYEQQPTGGLEQINIHSPLSPECPTTYYATPIGDLYVAGSLMPVIISDNSSLPGIDRAIFSLKPPNIDFSQNLDVYGIGIIYGQLTPFSPYNVTVIANDGYNSLGNKSGHFLQNPNPSDAIVTWYALDGDDRLEGGWQSIEIAYGGKGNDWYQISNIEDRAIELPDEGFDVVTITSNVKDYQFDPGTSIEAIFLMPGATVDPAFLPANVIFLNSSVDNRGPWSNTNISDVLPDILNGTSQNDALTGNPSDSTIAGQGGTDFINGGYGNDKIDGGAGNDILNGGTGIDSVNGGTGNDLIVGGSGEGNDTYNGGAGKDTVKYTSAEASITINLSASINQAYSTDMADGAKIGIDQLAMIENVIAGEYDDQVTGSKLANQLEGEAGNDVIRGEAGKDILIGGKGADVLFGGASVDKFTYRQTEETGTTPETADTIADFTVKGEKIDLAAIDASTLAAGNNVFLFNGGAPIGMSDQGEVSIVKVDNPDTANDYTMVYIDTDADPEPEASIRLNGLLNLTIKNFVL